MIQFTQDGISKNSELDLFRFIASNLSSPSSLRRMGDEVQFFLWKVGIGTTGIDVPLHLIIDATHDLEDEDEIDAFNEATDQLYGQSF